MQILFLDLEDVKSYATAHIEFRRGVNAIVGTNGAGKSTILEAIGFALFDHLGYRQQDFVREGKNSATITVTFISSLDDRQYQVVRRCGSSNQHYIFDAELDSKVCEGKADVLAFLRQHMGVEPGTDLARLFSDAVGVPQGTFTAAFLLTPAQRKGTFDPLLQVDEYRRAFDGLREPLSVLKARGQELAVEAAGLQARLEQLPELEAAIQQRTRELAAAEQTLAALTQQQSEVSAVRAQLESQQQEIRALQQERTTLDERRRESERRLIGAQRTLTEAEAAAAIVTEQQAGHDDYLAAQAEQRRLDEETRQRQRVRDRLSEADKALALTRSQLESIVTKVAAVAAAEQTVQRLAPAVADQRWLEAAVDEARQRSLQRRSLEQELARVEEELAAMRSRTERLTRQLEEAQQHEATRLKLEQTLAATQASLDEQREALGRMHAEADAVKEQTAVLQTAETATCPVCEQPLTPAHRTEMLTRNAQRLDELRSAYSAARQRIKEAEDALQQEQTRLKHVQQTLRQLPRAAELTELRTEVEQRGQALGELRQRLAELAEVPQQLADLEVQLQALGNPREQSAIAAAQAGERAAVERQRAELSEALASHEAASDSLKAELEAFAELDAAVAANAARLAEKSTAYQAVLSHRQLAESVGRRRQEVADVQKEQKALAQQLAAATQALTEAEAAFDETAYAAAVTREQQVRAELAGLQTRRTMLADDQAQDEARLARLQEFAHQLATITTRQRSLARQEEVLDALRSVLREAGPYITATLIRQVSADAARIFAELMQDYTRHLTWTEDYNILLNVDGNERQFSQLSGGEQMSAALAVRLALLHEMSSIDIAFFDEPTTNLDEARRDALARQIVSVKGLRQLFVISHDDTFEQATQNLIRVEKSGGISRVVE